MIRFKRLAIVVLALLLSTAAQWGFSKTVGGLLPRWTGPLLSTGIFLVACRVAVSWLTGVASWRVPLMIYLGFFVATLLSLLAAFLIVPLFMHTGGASGVFVMIGAYALALPISVIGGYVGSRGLESLVEEKRAAETGSQGATPL